MRGNKGPAVRQRLATAALELFGEHGYDAVSAAQIAARAGVTERTFFRHFASKREALFDGETVLRDGLLAAIDTIPTGVRPLDTLFQAVRSLTPLLEANRSFAEPRQQLIERTPVLAERELAKIAALTVTLAEKLTARGVDDPAAAIVAHVAMGVFAHATTAWLVDPAVGLDDRLVATIAAMKSVIGGATG